MYESLESWNISKLSLLPNTAFALSANSKESSDLSHTTFLPDVAPSKVASSWKVDIPVTNKCLVSISWPTLNVPPILISSTQSFFHLWPVEPRSYVLSSSGIIFESTSAPNTTLSVSE